MDLNLKRFLYFLAQELKRTTLLRSAQTQQERRTSLNANSSGAKTERGNFRSYLHPRLTSNLCSTNFSRFSWANPSEFSLTVKATLIWSPSTPKGVIWANSRPKDCQSLTVSAASLLRLIKPVQSFLSVPTSRIILAKFRKMKLSEVLNLTILALSSHSCTCDLNRNLKKLALQPEKKTSFAVISWTT